MANDFCPIDLRRKPVIEKEMQVKTSDGKDHTKKGKDYHHHHFRRSGDFQFPYAFIDVGS